ncbi:hypothetical protein Trydic_g19391 [Trypoxylus dichotomus]
MPLSFLPVPDETRLPRWYFGGVAATLAQVCIYPVDVVKIGLQTEQVMEKITTYRYARYLLQTQGFRRLYIGLPGSLRQQFLHSTSRFGIYHKIKEELQMKEVPFVVDLMLSAASGAVGALLKNPVEIINTRMLTDFKLSPPKRHNYRNTWHGLKLIMITHGYRGLFLGVQLNVMKSVAFTCSQICMYEQSKSYIRYKYGLKDTITTHIQASALAGLIATIVCQPIEVLKVRYMSKSDEFPNVWEVFKKQMHIGVMGFYRGTLLSFLKIEVQTITTFVLIEQMRLHYGVTPSICIDENEALVRDCIVAKKEPPKPTYFERILRLTHFLYSPLISGISWLLSWVPLGRKPAEAPSEEEVEEVEPVRTPIADAKDRLVRRVIIAGKLFYMLGEHITGKVFKPTEEEVEEEEHGVEEKAPEVMEKLEEDVEKPIKEEEEEEVDVEGALRYFERRHHIHHE